MVEDNLSEYRMNYSSYAYEEGSGYYDNGDNED